MSGKENEIMLRLSEKFPKLSESKQNYILGYVECLADLREENDRKPLQEVQCV